MRARLFCRTGELAGVDHPIEREATIGRSTQNSLQLGAAVVSQSHARISYDSDLGAFLLEDLQSKNGTRLDGVPVRGPQRLGPVHVVTLGDQHDFIFVTAVPDAAPVPRAAGATAPRPETPSDTVHGVPAVLDVPHCLTTWLETAPTARCTKPFRRWTCRTATS